MTRPPHAEMSQQELLAMTSETCPYQKAHTYAGLQLCGTCGFNRMGCVMKPSLEDGEVRLRVVRSDA